MFKKKSGIILTLLTLSFLVVTAVYAATSTWDFSTSSDYTFDNTKILFSAGQAQLKIPSDWYDGSWSKRKAITIDNTSNSSTLTNYQVKVTVTYDSDMRSDFGDIRFTDSDGTTLISSWQESSTTSSVAAYWVKIPSISASSNKTIYMYYGNASATDVSSGSSTFDVYDDLNSLTGYSTFGSGTWTIANDATRGNVFNAVNAGSDTGVYKTLSLPSSYVAQIYAKDTLADGLGSWGGPLMDMSGTTGWYRPGFSETDGIQVRDDNAGSFTNYGHSPTANFSVNTWYKMQSVFKTATQLSVASTINTSANYGNQGLATDGTYIYSSGTNSPTNGLAKYDRSGNLIASTTHSPTNQHYGGMQVVGTKLYAIIFDYITGPSDKTYIYSYNLDLTGETLVADLSSVTGNGGNALAYNNGYWIVGETGGNATNYNQHFYVFDTNWNRLKTIESPIYKDVGAQDATFKGNSLYVLQHDATLLVFTWDQEALELRLADSMPLSATYDEGIAYDSINDVFYIQDTSANKIAFANFTSLSTKRIISSFPHDTESHGAVSHDFTPRTQSLFGVGAYRDERFSQLIVRKYSFPEPIATTSSEAVPYPISNPTIQPNSATTFTSLSGFTETSTLNGGAIKYQISNNGGTTWYWYNSGWTTTVSGYTEANTASQINSNIATLPVGSGSFLWRAYLHSDGTQLVQLDNLALTYVNDATPPVLSLGSPSGTLSYGTTGATLSLTTDENATCKYGTVSGTAYGSIASTFTTTGGTSHSASLTGLSNATSYTYYIRCQDGQNNSNSSDYTISFSVAADSTVPTVSLTAPTNSATISGSNVAVSADASDNETVAGVKFYYDDTHLIGSEDISSPYAITWDSTSVSDGSHTLSAVARDNTGNVATSSSVTVTVHNAVEAPVSHGGGGGFSPPSPTTPVGGFTATADITNSQNKTVLHFGFGNDITNIAISDNINFTPATYINATSSIEWTATTTKILYIKYCNRYGRCSNPISLQINAFVPIVSNSYKFYKNLSYRMTNSDVKELQKYLNTHGFVIAQNGAGSLGKETNYFGLLTYKTLIKFQEAHASDILTPNGLKKGTGYFGPSTRAFVNK